jgi:hypothetical protein
MPLTLTPNIEPHIVLPTVSSEVMDDTVNAKAEDPLPLVDIPSGDIKVEVALPFVATPTDARPTVEPIVVSIDHHEDFTTKRMFSTRNNLLGLVREEVMKVGFSIVIGKLDKSGNGRNAFVKVIYER